jgi:hypothetical protein
VELDSHDILLSEGLPTESYLDTGNRTAFRGGGAFLESHPDFRPKHWTETCVPMVQEGPQLVRAKSALLSRAAALGYVTTEDSNVHVLADGQRVEPIGLGKKRLAFLLPAACASIELRCRTFVPAHIDATSGDTRALGICVGRMQIDGTDLSLTDASAFQHGWHQVEVYESHQQRWTTDRVPLPAGTRLLIVDTLSRSYCWTQPESSGSVVALFG